MRARRAFDQIPHRAHGVGCWADLTHCGGRHGAHRGGCLGNGICRRPSSGAAPAPSKVRTTGLGLVVTALLLEEPHRFGRAPPHHQRICRGDEAHREGPAPSRRPRGGHEGADHGGEDPAQGPERLEPHDHPAADPGRGEFAHQRRGDRQLGPEAQPHHEAQHDQRADAHRERGGARGQAVDQERQGEDAASADPVGEQTAHTRADRHPGEARRGDEGAVALGDPPVDAERGDHEGDQADVHRVQRPADAGGPQQLPVLAGEGQAIQALRPGQGAARVHEGLVGRSGGGAHRHLREGQEGPGDILTHGGARRGVSGGRAR